MTDNKRKYKFYLDEVLLETEPRGWDDITFFIKRDKDLNGILLFIDVELEFFDDGYDAIYNKFYGEGFCSTMDLRIMEQCLDGEYRDIHQGIIKLAKIEINEKDCSAKVKPDDNSFYAKIDKNRSLVALPWVGFSKNGEEITPAAIHQLSFFTPSTGVYHSLQAAPNNYASAGYRVYELFQYFIAYMTDDAVDFDSTLFGAGGEFEFLMITTGTSAFTATTGLTKAAFESSFPDMSFESLYKEMWKKRKLGFYFDYSGLKPKMFIELATNIPSGEDITTLDNIYEITTTIDTDRLYSIMKFGSQTTVDAASLAFPESIDWLGFKAETYNVLGDCGVDTELDLVSEYIWSHNVIEDAVETPTDRYEGQFIVVDCDSGYFAKQSNDLTPPAPPYYYNQEFINSKVAQSFTGSVPAPIARQVGNLDGTFFATRTSDGSYIEIPKGALGTWFEYEPIPFENDYNAPNHDNDNVWNAGVVPAAGAATFTAPANGTYSFSAAIKWHFYHNNFPESAETENEIWLRRYDSLGVLITSYRLASWWSQAQYYDYDKILTGSTSLQLLLGEKIKVMFRTKRIGSVVLDNNTAFRVLHGSTFSCDQAAIGRAGFHSYDPKDYFGLVHEFDYPINETQWQSILSKIRGNIVFAQKNQDFRRAPIDTIRFNKSGISKIKLIRSINTT